MIVLPRRLPASVLDGVVQPILWSIGVAGDDVWRRPARHDLVRGQRVHVVVRRVQHLGTCKAISEVKPGICVVGLNQAC